MPLLLAERDPGAREIMDEPDCDPGRLNNTYRQFCFVNAISRAGWMYRRWIRPAMTRSGQLYSLLDIGFGGGDIPSRIAGWATRDGLRLQVTAIEVDRRAYDYVHSFRWPDNLSFQLVDIHELAARGERFDFVISNHVVHHLDQRELAGMLRDAAHICRRFALFTDLRRSDLAYLLFAVAAYPLFRNSYIRHDGLSSLRRSYTFSELKSLVPTDWQVARLFPFRLVLSHRTRADPQSAVHS